MLLSILSIPYDSGIDTYRYRKFRYFCRAWEAAEIGDKKSLELVEDAAKGVNSLLQDAARELRTGHQYLNIVVKGQAQTGNAYSSDWRGSATGVSHKYDGVEVGVGGKALIGDKYGGKDFWD